MQGARAGRGRIPGRLFEQQPLRPPGRRRVCGCRNCPDWLRQQMEDGVEEKRCLLSVIVPVWNMASEDRLLWCMNSLLGQEGIADYEIIAVDDASTDGSLELLRSMEREHPEKLHVLHSETNRRQGGAKNLGLAAAAGEWIAFIDADDWVVPDYFARLLRKAEATGADCVGTDYCIVYEHTMESGTVIANGRVEQTGELDDEKRRLLLLDSGSLCVKIYRREIVVDCPSRFPENMFYEDNALAGTWIMRMHRYEYVPGPLYYYYQHEDSTVHTVTAERLEDRLRAGRIMLEEAGRYGFLERFRPELEYSFTVLFYKNTVFSALQGMKEKGVYSFVTRVAGEMRRTFPDFQENPYYKEKIDAEEKRLMKMQMENPLWFYLYYRLLWMYRRVCAADRLQRKEA